MQTADQKTQLELLNQKATQQFEHAMYVNLHIIWMVWTMVISKFADKTFILKVHGYRREYG